MLDVVTPEKSIIITKVSVAEGLVGLKLNLWFLPKNEERVKASG